MTFSYDRTWQDFVAMLRANPTTLVTLAAVFIFFPSFALFVFAPVPEPVDAGPTAIQIIVDYYRANMGWFLIVNAVSAFAQVAIFLLLLDRARPTVGEALRVAAALFPSFFLAQILTNLATGAGIALLVVPGIYLLGRLAVVAPLLVDRRVANPLRAIAEGWAATAGRGWRIAGLVLLVVIVSWIALSAATSVLTVIGALVLPEAARPIVGGFATGLSSAALGLIVVVIAAAIYRQLNGRDSVADVFS